MPGSGCRDLGEGASVASSAGADGVSGPQAGWQERAARGWLGCGFR